MNEPQATSTDSADAVVIGSGPGGLMAAAYLAAAGRHLRLSSPDAVWDFAQRTSEDGVAMVMAPDSPDHVAAALGSDGASLGEWCAGLDGIDVLVDLGRIGTGSPSWALAQWCDLVLLCASPTADQLQACASRLDRLAAAKVATGWLLIGKGPYSDDHIVETYGIPVSAHLPSDPKGAAAIDGRTGSRVLRRSPLVREGRRLAEALGSWAPPDAAVEEDREAA